MMFTLGPFITAINTDTQTVDELHLTLDEEGFVLSPTYSNESYPVTIYVYDPKKQCPICLVIRKNESLLGFFVHKLPDNTYYFRPAQIPAINGEWHPPFSEMIRAIKYELKLEACLIVTPEQQQIIDHWYTTWKAQQISLPTLKQKNKEALDKVFEQMKALCASNSEIYPLNEWQQEMARELIDSNSSWQNLKNNTSPEDYKTALHEIMNAQVNEGKNYTEDAKALLLYVAAPAINFLNEKKFYAGAENGAENVTIAHVYYFMIKALAIECGDDPTQPKISHSFKAPESNTEREKIGELTGEEIQLIIGSDLSPEIRAAYENLRDFIHYCYPNIFNNETEFMINDNSSYIISKLKEAPSDYWEKLLEITKDITQRNHANNNGSDDVFNYLCATFPGIDIHEKLNEIIPMLENVSSKAYIDFFNNYWHRIYYYIANKKNRFLHTAKFAIAFLHEHPIIIAKFIDSIEDEKDIEMLIEKEIITIDLLDTMLSSLLPKYFSDIFDSTLRVVGTYIHCFIHNYYVVTGDDLKKLDVIFKSTPSFVQSLEARAIRKWEGMKHLLWFVRIKSIENIDMYDAVIRQQLACDPQRIAQTLQAWKDILYASKYYKNLVSAIPNYFTLNDDNFSPFFANLHDYALYDFSKALKIAQFLMIRSEETPLPANFLNAFDDEQLRYIFNQCAIYIAPICDNFSWDEQINLTLFQLRNFKTYVQNISLQSLIAIESQKELCEKLQICITLKEQLDRKPQMHTIAENIEKLIAEEPHSKTFQEDLYALLPNVQTYAEILLILNETALKKFIKLTIKLSPYANSTFLHPFLPYLRNMEDFARVLEYLDYDIPNIFPRLTEHTHLKINVMSANFFDILFPLSDKNKKLILDKLKLNDYYYRALYFNKPNSSASENKWSEYFDNMWKCCAERARQHHSKHAFYKTIGKILRLLSAEELQKFQALPTLLKKDSTTDVSLCVLLFPLNNNQRNVIFGILREANYLVNDCISILNDITYRKTAADWYNTPPEWLRNSINAQNKWEPEENILSLFDYCNDIQIQTLTQFIRPELWFKMRYHSDTDTIIDSFWFYTPKYHLCLERHQSIVVFETQYKSFVQEAENHSAEFERRNYGRFMTHEMLNVPSFVVIKKTIINMMKEFYLPPEGSWMLSSSISHMGRDIFSKKVAKTLIDHLNPIENLKKMQYILTQYLMFLAGDIYHKKYILQPPLYRRLLYAIKITEEFANSLSLTMTSRNDIGAGIELTEYSGQVSQKAISVKVS